MPPDQHATPTSAPSLVAAAPPKAAARSPLSWTLGAVLALIPLHACGDTGPMPRNMALAAMWDAGSPGARTAQSKARLKEYKVKAALLLNFIKYAKFPKSAFPSGKAPIDILIVGKDPFGPLLEKAFAKKKLHGRTVVIKRSRRIPKTLSAHLVFAGGLSDKDRAALITLSKNKSCLLVGETTGFAQAGGFINLYLKKGKVKFEVNPERQKDTKIKLKAELLKLALIVKPSKPKEGESR